MNKELSRKRADSVRTYIVTHGFPEDRVTAEGAGEAQPVADNKTAEGRANNRRVEIIVHLAAGQQQQMPGDRVLDDAERRPAGPAGRHASPERGHAVAEQRQPAGRDARAVAADADAAAELHATAEALASLATARTETRGPRCTTATRVAV